MNPMETLRELWAGIVYMFQRWRGKETDKLARRVATHQGVFGRSRLRVLSDGSAQNESLIRNGQEKKRSNPSSRAASRRLDEVMVEVEREVFLGSERQWLGVEDNHDYILGSVTREKSECFEDAVANELYTRGYTIRGKALPAPPPRARNSPPKTEVSRHSKHRSVSRDVDVEQGHIRGGSQNRSWWRNIYQRVSQSGGDDEQEKHLTPHPKRKSVSRPNDRVQALPLINETPIGGTGYAYEDPPPPSTLSAYRSSRLVDVQREISPNPTPHVSPPSSDVAHRSPSQPKPKTKLGRSDSLLDRVFAYLGSDAHATNTELDHGTESQPSPRSSLWRAGSAKVVSKHVQQMSSVTQANVSEGIDPRPVTPVRGDVGVPSRGVETPTPLPNRSHIRDTANHFGTPPYTPPPQQLPLAARHPPVRHDPPINRQLPHHPPGIPEPNAGHYLSFPYPPLRTEPEPRRHTPERGHVDPRGVYPFQMPSPQSHSPPQQGTVAGLSSSPNLKRPHRASRNEALLRPFSEPVHHPPPNTAPTRFTPPRSQLTIPAPLAQPLPRGSGSLRRDRANTMPVPEHISVDERPYRESRSRRNSQPVPVPRHTAGPHYVPYPPDRPPRNPNRRTSQPLPALQETSPLYASPPSSPPQRSSRRSSAPPMSELPPHRPTRSNAVLRKSPGSPTLPTSPRMNLLAELRSTPATGNSDFSRYPTPGPSPGTGSPPRNNRTRSPPSPRTPPFVNTHMLPSPTTSPGSDVEEWASAVSFFQRSPRTQR